MKITVENEKDRDLIVAICDVATKAAGLQVAKLAVQIAESITIETESNTKKK